jgi:hypothetical protein
MTLAVGETNRTRINSEIVQLGTRATALEGRATVLEGRFPITGGVLTYSGDVDGFVPVEQVFRLHAGLAGADATGAQSMFGVGCALAASTVYQFDIVASFTKSAGTTSHQFRLLFGGTATLNSITYTVLNSSVAVVPGATVASFIHNLTSASTATITSAMAVASNHVRVVVRGIVSCNVAGTFIPQYSLSAAPGGAYTTDANSFMRIAPIGAHGANTSIGTWA